MENVCLHLHDSDFMVKENTGHITDVLFLPGFYFIACIFSFILFASAR